MARGARRRGTGARARRRSRDLAIRRARWTRPGTKRTGAMPGREATRGRRTDTRTRVAPGQKGIGPSGDRGFGIGHGGLLRGDGVLRGGPLRGRARQSATSRDRGPPGRSNATACRVPRAGRPGVRLPPSVRAPKRRDAREGEAAMAGAMSPAGAPSILAAPGSARRDSPPEAEVAVSTGDGPVGAGCHVTELKHLEVQILDVPGRRALAAGKLPGIPGTRFAALPGRARPRLHAWVGHGDDGPARYAVTGVAAGDVGPRILPGRSRARPARTFEDARGAGAVPCCCGGRNPPLSLPRKPASIAKVRG